jgi:hypothetical protein
MGTIFPFSFIQIQNSNQDFDTLPLLNILQPLKPTETVPTEYSDEIDLNGVYVYNVTNFGGVSSWFNYDMNASEVWKKWKTDQGGQIKINFTGFYHRHPNDTYGYYFLKFPHTNMPYMDINITESGGSVNLSRYNCSNSEIFNNMAIGHWPFDSGFLIPKNMTYVKKLASESATENNLELGIDESYHFIQFNFQDDYQNTELIYNRINGLLISVNVSVFGYQISMFLTNFTLDFNEFSEQYAYKVNSYEGGATFWYDFAWQYVDTWTTNPDGNININFTGYYNKDPLDTSIPDVFDNSIKRAWMDLQVYYEGYFGPIGPIIDFSNMSNREVASNMIFGYNSFQSGFLIPSVENIIDLKNKANDAVPSGASLNIEETELTITFEYTQITGFTQITNLIYEKKTGLLLRADTTSGAYRLKTTLDGFEYEEKPSDEGIPLLLLIITQSFSHISD